MTSAMRLDLSPYNHPRWTGFALPDEPIGFTAPTEAYVMFSSCCSALSEVSETGATDALNSPQESSNLVADSGCAKWFAGSGVCAHHKECCHPGHTPV